MWVPPKVRRELVDERRRFHAGLLRAVELQHQLEAWNRELRQVDPYLQLVKAHDDASDVPGLRPGYYHVLRHNPGAPPSLIPIEGPDGSFREPDSSLFDMLRRSDMWNHEAERDRRVRGRRLEQAQQAREARERAERKEEALLRLKALEEPGVAFTDRPWTYRAGARRAK